MISRPRVVWGCRLRLRESYIDTGDAGIGMLCCEGDSPDAGVTADVDDALVGRLEQGSTAEAIVRSSHWRCC